MFNKILQSSMNHQIIKNGRIYMNRTYVKCYDFDPLNYDKSNCGIIHDFEKKNTINKENKTIKYTDINQKKYQIIYTNNLIILGNNEKNSKNIKNE